MGSHHPTRKASPVKRKRYNSRLIKQAKSYDIGEICMLFGLHKNTVLHWVKSGLQPIDNKRPMLIYGATLKSFLDERQKKRRQKCAPNQMFCLKCRMPKQPLEGLADLTFKTNKIAHIAALCETCLTPMNRNIKSADIPEFEKALHIKKLGELTLSAPHNPRLNCDFKKDENTC